MAKIPMEIEAEVMAGDPCPECGGKIMGTVEMVFGRVPIDRDGYDVDGLELSRKAYDSELVSAACDDCEMQVEVEWPQ